jgi:opacity protein-like surface antigen
VALLAAALLCPTTRAAAQSEPRGIGLGIMAGASIPFGDYADIAKSGWDLGAFLDFGRASSPLGFRLEAAYHGFGDEDVLFNPPGGPTSITIRNKYKIVDGTANIVLGLPLQSSPLRPYLIGGAGVYYLKNAPTCSTNTNCATGFIETSDTKFGINGGGGIELGLTGLSVFAEARWHSVFSSIPTLDCFGSDICSKKAAQLVPVNVGLSWHF